MKRSRISWILAIFCLFSTVLVITAAEGKNKKEKWTSIFNGKDLSGWKVKICGHDLGDNYNDTFRVENGVLKVSYDKYDNFQGKFGHIFYEKKYSKYRLRFEYRFTGDQAPGGPGWAFRNSGVMLHCQSPESMGKNQKFPVSAEFQLLGGDGKKERSTGNLCTPGTHVEIGGKLLKQHVIKSNGKTFHGDQWVKAEAYVDGNKVIKHIINGEVVHEYNKPQYDEKDSDAKNLIKDGNKLISEGYFSFQAESHPCEFRNIEIMPLDD